MEINHWELLYLNKTYIWVFKTLSTDQVVASLIEYDRRDKAAKGLLAASDRLVYTLRSEIDSKDALIAKLARDNAHTTFKLKLYEKAVAGGIIILVLILLTATIGH